MVAWTIKPCVNSIIIVEGMVMEQVFFGYLEKNPKSQASKLFFEKIKILLPKSILFPPTNTKKRPLIEIT